MRSQQRHEPPARCRPHSDTASTRISATHAGLSLPSSSTVTPSAIWCPALPAWTSLNSTAARTREPAGTTDTEVDVRQARRARQCRRRPRGGHDANSHSATKRTYVLRGTVACDCGRLMRGVHHRNNRVYYQCAWRQQSRSARQARRSPPKISPHSSRTATGSDRRALQPIAAVSPSRGGCTEDTICSWLSFNANKTIYFRHSVWTTWR